MIEAVAIKTETQYKMDEIMAIILLVYFNEMKNKTPAIINSQLKIAAFIFCTAPPLLLKTALAIMIPNMITTELTILIHPFFEYFFFGIGYPHFGHMDAMLDISFPHSGHLISDIT